MRFEGKVAIISGAGPGTGRQVALLMAKEGADLVLAARTASTLESIASEVRALGQEAITVPTDVTRREEAKNLADRAFERFGRMDVLVNNAFGSAVFKPVAEYTDDDLDTWHGAMDTGAWGTMLVCRYVAPHMLEAGRGAIVNVTSMSSRVGYARLSNYAAAKAGVHLLSHALADELGPKGIRVNIVAPGHIWSDKLKAYYEEGARQAGVSYEAAYQDRIQEMALRRIATEEEVAKAILFLASDQSSGITGAVLDVNAGHKFKHGAPVTKTAQAYHMA